MRLIGFLIFGFVTCFSFSFALSSDSLFSYKESLVFDYQKQFIQNNFSPLLDISEPLINPRYPAISLYIDQSDLPYLLQQKDDEKSVDVLGMYMPNSEGNFLLSGRSEKFFTKVSMRGVTSLTCTKPSFTLPTVGIKLKGMCGSDFGLEEQVFSQPLVAAMNSDDGVDKPHSAFWAPHTLHNVFLNGKFYGVYELVPELNKDFLSYNGLTDVSQRNSCIFKVYKLITKNNNPDNIPILTTLDVVDRYDYDDVVFLADLKYGKERCYSQLDNLLSYLNAKRLGDIGDLIDKKSVLQRGVTNILANTMLSFEHNYLLVIHHGKYYAGFWDNEGFRGCINNTLDFYWNQDHQNLLFSHVLKRYEDNDPQALSDMVTHVRSMLCNQDILTTIAHNDLPYILFDRYLRNIGHYSTLDYKDRVANYLLYDIYYGRINFADYRSLMTSFYDDYFVSFSGNYSHN